MNKDDLIKGSKEVFRSKDPVIYGTFDGCYFLSNDGSGYQDHLRNTPGLNGLKITREMAFATKKKSDKVEIASENSEDSLKEANENLTKISEKINAGEDLSNNELSQLREIYKSNHGKYPSKAWKMPTLLKKLENES